MYSCELVLSLAPPPTPASYIGKISTCDAERTRTVIPITEKVVSSVLILVRWMNCFVLKCLAIWVMFFFLYTIQKFPSVKKFVCVFLTLYTVKKLSIFLLTKVSLAGNNLIIPMFRESSVSDIPGGDGKIDNPFFTVYKQADRHPLEQKHNFSC